MAKQCFVEPVSRHRAMLALCFILIGIIVAEGVGWFYTAKYYDEHRTRIIVTMSPSKLQMLWKCRLCNAENEIVEVVR